MKKRTKEPWMAADAYGRSLKPGIGLNLLVTDVAGSVAFQTGVLGATAVYDDEDIAVMRFHESEWMLHADHTYLDNPMTGVIAGVGARGAGLEIRLYGCEPDVAELRAREAGHVVLCGALDKPHGMREAFLVDEDGYVWVPGMALPA